MQHNCSCGGSDCQNNIVTQDGGEFVHIIAHDPFLRHAVLVVFNWQDAIKFASDIYLLASQIKEKQNEQNHREISANEAI